MVNSFESPAINMGMSLFSVVDSEFIDSPLCVNFFSFFDNCRTRVVQKIMETMTNKEQYSMIVSALKPDIVSLIKNANGSHVAQRCLEYLSPRFREVNKFSLSLACLLFFPLSLPLFNCNLTGL